jgi:hypothetical protein
MTGQSFYPKVIFEGSYDNTNSWPEYAIKDTFTVLEVDGVYLVICHKITHPGLFKREYKAFLEEKDAFAYLRKQGVTRPEDEEEAMAEAIEERLRNKGEEDYIFEEYLRDCGLYRE